MLSINTIFIGKLARLISTPPCQARWAAAVADGTRRS